MSGRLRDSWAALSLLPVSTAGVLALVTEWTGTLPGGPGSWTLGASVLLPLGLVADLARVGRATAALRPVAVGCAVLLCALAAYTLLLPSEVLAGQADRSTDESLRGVLGLAAVAASALAVAGPLSRRLRANLAENHLTDRQIAADVRRRLRSEQPFDEVLLQVVELLRAELASAGAEIWTAEGDRLVRRVGVPSRPPRSLGLSEQEQAVACRTPIGGARWVQVWIPALLEEPHTDELRVVPLTHAGELLGVLLVRRPSPRTPFQPADDDLLVEVARQVAQALYGVRLDSALQQSLAELRQRNVELQASRARIVATADAARRSLERDLHDGGQKELTQLARTLKSIQIALDSANSAAAAELLTAAQAELKEATETLRELAHGIFPTALRDFGLSEGLRGAARRSNLPVRVEVNLASRHPEEIETAVYFCCVEAMQNAGKHAGDQANVTVLVADTDGLLTFEVADDGAGYSTADTRPGHGLLNMQDRVGSLGGRLFVDSAPGAGTTVRGEIPLP
ncbi:MAG: ATP-binding protein [Sporichthyaceae bacterium]